MKPETLLVEAQALLAGGQREQAGDLLAAGCRSFPGSAEVWDALGLLRASDADWAGALGAFAEAGRLAPARLAYGLHRVEAAVRSGSGEAELRRLTLAASLNPLDVTALAVRGALLGALGREAEGIDALAVAALLAPDSAEMHALLGSRLADAERLAEAEAALRRAITLGAADPDLRNTLGAVLMRRYRHAEAYAELAALIAAHGDSVVPLCNLASAAVSLGRQEEGEALLAQASALAPEAILP